MDDKSMEFFSIKGSWLKINNPEVINLIGLPKDLNEIKKLKITGRELNSDVPVPMNFRSFKGLPDKLPMLESIYVYDSVIQTLETLSAEIPRLKYIWFSWCHFHNLKGIPKTRNYVSFGGCKIDSFEGLDINNLNILDKSAQHAFLYKTSFSSLHSIDHTTLWSVLIEYFSRFGNFYAPANLTPKGIDLLNACVNREVNNANNPLVFVRRELPHIYPPDFEGRGISIDSEIKRNGINFLINVLNENGIEYSGFQNWEDAKSSGEGMEDWIYALSLEERLFIPEKIDRLLEFYKKSPAELALEYRSNPKSLSKVKIERLIHEGDPYILKILEDDEYSTLSPDDPIITQISKKFIVKTKNGKILL